MQLLSDRAEQPEYEPVCRQRLLSWLPSGVRLLLRKLGELPDDRYLSLGLTHLQSTAALISNAGFAFANSLNRRAAAPGCSLEKAIKVGPTNASFSTS